MSNIDDVENYYLAPQACRCLCQKEFLLPPNPMFPCWDIREEQFEKTVAYVQALHYWAEKFNLPMPGQPCLLVRCILEPRRTMEPYMSFSTDAILDSVALQEGSLEDLTGVTIPRNATPSSTSTSSEEDLQKSQHLQRLPPKEQPLLGSPLRDQATQWKLSANLQRN